MRVIGSHSVFFIIVHLLCVSLVLALVVVVILVLLNENGISKFETFRFFISSNHVFVFVRRWKMSNKARFFSLRRRRRSCCFSFPFFTSSRRVLSLQPEQNK